MAPELEKGLHFSEAEELFLFSPTCLTSCGTAYRFTNNTDNSVFISET